MTRRLVAYVAVAYLLAVTLPVAAHAGTTAAAQKSATTAKATASKEHAHHPGAKAPAMPKIDINTASASDLAALPGIDQATADKIVAGRPFKNSSQILSKGIVTKEEYSKIRNRITARQSSMEAKNPAKETPKTPGSSEGTTTK